MYVEKHKKYVVSPNNANLTFARLLISQRQVHEKMYVYRKYHKWNKCYKYLYTQI